MKVVTDPLWFLCAISVSGDEDREDGGPGV